MFPTSKTQSTKPKKATALIPPSIITCTNIPRPLKNIKLSRTTAKYKTGKPDGLKCIGMFKKFESKSKSSLRTSSYSSSSQSPIKAIPPDEYYDSSGPSRFFGSSSGSGSGPSRSSKSTSMTPSTSVTPSTSNSLTPSVTPSKGSIIIQSPSPAGTSKSKEGNGNPKSPERDSGHGDFESELQFSSVSSPSLFDPVSDSDGSGSEETDSCSYSYSNSYSYTCSNSCCTTGCFSDNDIDVEERSQTSRSRLRSRPGSKSTRSVSAHSGYPRNHPDLEQTQNEVDSDLLTDTEELNDQDRSFEAYLKRVEKLRKTLGNWDSFLTQNGISRPDFFCRYKERESLKQIVDEFQKITSRHREGFLSALEKRTWKSCGELGYLGDSGSKVRKNRRVRRFLDKARLSDSGHDNGKDDMKHCFLGFCLLEDHNLDFKYHAVMAMPYISIPDYHKDYANRNMHGKTSWD